jgi:uncharacterized repeat protein (TIGR01451 family)
MGISMKVLESDRRYWILVAVILLVGLLFVLIAGDWAIRFTPSWRLAADMRSQIDPNSVYLTRPVDYVVPPLDPAILTQPVWIEFFLTPGAIVPTRVPVTPAPELPTITSTQAVPATPTFLPTASPTNPSVFFPATRTSYPAITNTSRPRDFTATPPLAEPSPIPGSTRVPQADLHITMNNNVVVYSPGGTLIYTVVVTNQGPDPVAGAVLIDEIPSQITAWSWECTSQINGASGCAPQVNSTAGFSATVDLPGGASIVYTVTANILGNAAGTLANTVSVAAPAGVIDPLPGNNSATDMDDLLYSMPYGAIGTNPDGSTAVISPGTAVTLAFDTPLVVGGHPDWDLVLYELKNGSGIAMDLITLQISDGNNWYTVFNWGDNLADTNSNMNIGVLGGSETDNRAFTSPPASDVLYPFGTGTTANPATGIVIELDNVVPAGTYPYFRISSPAGGDMDGGCEIDAIVIVP